jgi:hypothetical protein
MDKQGLDDDPILAMVRLLNQGDAVLFKASMTASMQAARSAYLDLKWGLVLDLSAGPKAFCALTSAVAIFCMVILSELNEG